jgi:hypothetical protein
MRGLRSGLALVWAILSAVWMLPVASANPIATMDEYLLDVPVVLVLLNFPINGLVLLLMYSVALDRSKAWRPSTRRGFIVDVSVVVLLFSSIGALIDLAVFGMTYRAPASFLALPIGLAAVFGSCIFVCFRYLGMSRDMAAGTGALLLLVNFVSWGGLMTETVTFLYVCVPAVVLLWVVFEVLLVRRAARYGAPSLAPMVPSPMLAPAYGHPPEAIAATPLTVGMGDSLRVEAVSLCITLLFLLAVLSLYGFNNVIYA